MKKVNIKYLSVFLIVAVIALLSVSGCFLPNVKTSPPASPPATTPTTSPTSTNTGWTLPSAEEQNLPLPDFISVVTKIKPSVVVIKTEVVVSSVFGPSTQEAAGSGWIIDEAGYVVTNNHVVEGAQSITVTLDDGRTFPADIVGTDPFSDIAVIKIDAKNLIKANVGHSSQLKVGEWVLAIGNSLDLGVTPSEGIVRSLEASVPVSAGQTLYGLIGTSAAINPGNSGGPLVNMQGEVVGITTIKIAMVGVEAMGWAIGIDTAGPIIEELINSGYIVRPWLGITCSDADQWPAIRYAPAVDKGAFITNLVSGSPADKAGLKAGDVIVSFNGKEVTTAQELVQAIHTCQVGQKVEIIFWRGQTKKTTSATLAESPPPS